MDRAHVTLDNGQEAEVHVRNFTVRQGLNCEPEVTIEGILSRLGAALNKPVNCRCVPTASPLGIKRVFFNNPATVIYWSDDTRTVVKCQPGDDFNHELGFLLAVCKKVCGNNGRYNELLREYVPGYGEKEG